MTGPAALDERPRRRRVALLAAPWALALALVIAALVARPGAPTPGPTLGAGASSSATPTAPTPEPAVPAETRHPMHATAADTVPATTHLQVLAQARAALGTAGLAAEADSRSDQWPIEVRLAEVARVTDTVAIATVHALVIELADGDWTGPVARAVAVPLTMSPEPRVAGPAWPLSAPPLAVVTPDGQTVADPDPALLSPLEQAGWTVDELTTVELVGGAVLRIELIGVPPHEAGPGHHEVWLLDAPGGPRLLPLEEPEPHEATDTTQEST